MFGTHNSNIRKNLNESALKFMNSQYHSRRTSTGDPSRVDVIMETGESVRCLLYPRSLIKRGWSLFLAVLLLYVATVMPFTMAFVDTDDGAWFYFNLCLDAAFLTDVVINMFSAYYDEDNRLVTNRRKIIMTYLRGWFLVDLVVSFPFNLIENQLDSGTNSGNYNNILRLLRLPRLYRLLKIARLIKLINFVKRSAIVVKIQDFF